MYIDLLEEAGEESGMCGKFRYCLYGFKRAAQAWEDFYAKKLESVGFKRGHGSGVVFYNVERDVSRVCRGDDFTLMGEEVELGWLEKLMREMFEIKVRAVLGPEVKDDNEVVILGRVVRWTDEGVEFEADPRHRKVLMEYFAFGDGVKGAAVNGDRDRRDEEMKKGMIWRWARWKPRSIEVWWRE